MSILNETAREQMKQLKDDYTSFCEKIHRHKKIHKVLSAFYISTHVVGMLAGGGCLTLSLTGLGVLAGIPLGGVVLFSNSCGLGLNILDHHFRSQQKKYERLRDLSFHFQQEILSQFYQDDKLDPTEFKDFVLRMQEYLTKKGEINQTLQVDWPKLLAKS